MVQYASQEVRCAGGPKVEFGPSLNCAGGPGAESGPAPDRALSGPLALMLKIGPGVRIQLVPPSRCWRGSGTARPGAQEQTPGKASRLPF